MADTPISGLTSIGSALAGGDEFPFNDVSATATKKVTATQLRTWLQDNGAPIVRQLTADKTLSSTTGAKATDLDVASLAAGTYVFTYYLLCQSAATSTAPRFGVNFTGTAAVRHFFLRFPSTGTTASSGVADDVGATSGQIHESMPHTTFTTTAPNLGPASLATAATPILFIVEGLMVVTASGNLEMYHAGSAAASTTMLKGSSLVVIRTA